MIDNSYYSQEVHGPYELFDVGDLNLEDGGTIRGCRLAYATFSTLNTAKDNAILIPTWYSGTNKIIEQGYNGTGRALDPGKYFIIIVNQLSNGLSSSPHNTPPPAGMGNFRTCALARIYARSTNWSLRSLVWRAWRWW
jgi:homoserine O-acetyltransferase